MKQLIFILLIAPTCCFSQQIYISLPVESTTVNWYHMANLKYLQKEAQNEIRIEAETCPNRNISIAMDTIYGEFDTHWAPIQVGKEWNEPLAEYTLSTAKRLGGIKDLSESNNYKYVDNEQVYWQKTFKIEPHEANSIEISVYCELLEKMNFLGNLKIEIK